MGGTSTRPMVAWGMAALLCGCAKGGDPELTGQAYDGPDVVDDGGTMTSTGTGPNDEGSEDPGPLPTADGPPAPDLGACANDSDCVIPAGSCLETQGHCDAGTCQHGAADPGTACDDLDPCTLGDACDGEGVCFGVELDCSTMGGGTCVGGMCTGTEECPPGFEDCNGDGSCETELGTTANCGGCGDACSAGAHADALCVAGSCDYSCQAPWEDCDGDGNNGCEVPVGVPHQCDANGLNPGSGCWTAYCGNSGDPNATNFGSFHCIDCATCRAPAAGQCQWCNHSSGVFYPADACFCGTYEDLAC